MRFGLIGLLLFATQALAQEFIKIPSTVKHVILHTGVKVVVRQGSETGYHIVGHPRSIKKLDVVVDKHSVSVEDRWLKKFEDLLRSLPSRMKTDRAPSEGLEDSTTVFVTVMNLELLSIGGPGTILTDKPIYGSDIRLSNNGKGKLWVSDMKFDKMHLSLSGNGTIGVDYSALKFASISVNGSGTLRMDSLFTNATHLSLSGGGSIDLTGSTSTLSCVLNGSGQLQASKYVTTESIVSLSGSGSARINVTKHLKLRISGVGSVYFSGEPSLDFQRSGKGTLMKANSDK